MTDHVGEPKSKIGGRVISKRNHVLSISGRIINTNADLHSALVRLYEFRVGPSSHRFVESWRSMSIHELLRVSNRHSILSERESKVIRRFLEKLQVK